MPHETPWVVWLPLVLLAIPSVIIGAIAIGPMLFGDFFAHGVVFDKVIFIGENHPALHEMAEEFHGWAAMGLHSVVGPAGVAGARGRGRRVVPVPEAHGPAGR